MTEKDIAMAFILFDKLEYGKGKVAAATVLRSTVSQYISSELNKERGDSSRNTHFTTEEIRLMKEGKKINAIKSVRDRTKMTLLQTKRYVEKFGCKFLQESGQYDSRGFVKISS